MNGDSGSSGGGTATENSGNVCGEDGSTNVSSPGRARTAVKILYRSCDEDVAREQRADLAVKSLELDEVLMAALRAELDRSQLWYPEPQRTQGQDRVGLIIL